MTCLKYLFSALIYACIVTPVWAGGTQPKIEKQPSWVAPIRVNYSATSLDDEAEDGYSDLHYEKQVLLERQSTFVKKVLHVLTDAGVQSLSQVSVDYNPLYEQLSFHSVRILRGGQCINQLQLSRIKTIQQEKELDRSIYNGKYTAVLILDDLRKDDILEYSYTIRGFNPIFENKYADNYLTKFDVPIYGLYYRLLVPKGRKVTVSNSNTEVKPVISTTATETAYAWTISNEHAVQVEKGLPSWYDVYPMVMVSEYNSWKDVNDWALKLFPFSTPLSAGMQKKIEEIKSTSSTAGARLLAALHFVQDDVRYMGIEMGENSHKPHAPSQVFEQRFGDCKDKAYLLCTMLRAMNIEAYPVLINTSYKKTVTGWLPSPKAFDHLTVCAIVNNKAYWLDATIAYQRGSLNEIFYPPYETGFVIKPGNAGFTAIPLQNKGKTKVKEAFYVTSNNKPARLVVTTTYSGSYADDMRYNFKSKSVREIEGECKSFYKPYFKKLTVDNLTYEDNEQSGLFTTTEYYTLRNFWKEGDETSLSFEPYLINGVIKTSEDESRSMPFALSYPANYEEEVEINLPEDWSITPSSNHFKTDAFAFDCEYSNAQSNVVSLKYRYQNFKDHVEAADVSAYADQWEEAEKRMVFRLSEKDAANASLAKQTLAPGRNGGFVLAYVILGACAFGTFLYRRAKPQRRFWK